MKVDKPWGSYEVLLDQPTYKVKRIIILPEQQLSLQYHNLREEHWTIVEGSVKKPRFEVLASKDPFKYEDGKVAAIRAIQEAYRALRFRPRAACGAAGAS